MLHPHLPAERLALSLELAGDAETQTPSARSVVLEDALDLGLAASEAGLGAFWFVGIVLIALVGRAGRIAWWTPMWMGGVVAVATWSAMWMRTSWAVLVLWWCTRRRRR